MTKNEASLKLVVSTQELFWALCRKLCPLLVLVCLLWSMYEIGHRSGVKDHANGSYVVVHMPDGTDEVYKVKENK